MTNRLFYGDNLDILRRYDYFPSESVDLIYLDPPFNSSRSYNVLFKDKSGVDSEAQIKAFEDTWDWGPTASATYNELWSAGGNVATAIKAIRDLVGDTPMLAYLVMMTARLIELHRVLKPTGSLYLHCDPTASHYLKVILDAIFGKRNFRNEIIWCYRKWAVAQPQYCSNHDVILFYTKSETNVFNTLYVPVSEGTMKRWKGKKQKAEFVDGVRIATSEEDSSAMTPMPDWWTISILNPNAKERLGYPTQKPLALLERIIEASSNPGDVVLDPFCGCGTAIAAAQSLGRRWIGIDITYLSVSLQKYRLADMFGLVAGTDYEVIGEPVTLDGARQLAQDDRFQFQFWAGSLIQARPYGAQAGGRTGRRGADRGIDGTINFTEGATNEAKRVIVSVKSGGVSSRDIRDLVGTVDREQAAIGVLITLEPPSRPMIQEAASAGFYRSNAVGYSGDYPKIQILTVEELLAGKTVDMPPAYGTFKQAERVEQKPESHNLPLFPPADLD